MKFTKATWATSVVIVLLLAGLTVPIIESPSPSPKSRTQSLLIQIHIACVAFKIEYGSYPSSFENHNLTDILIGNNPRKIVFMEFLPKDLNQNKEMIDGWGTPIRIEIQPDQTLSFLSAGKDKVFNTSDDIKDKKSMTAE